MTIPANLKKAHAALRAFALKYPEAWEDFPWGHSAYKVKAKIYLSLYQHEAEAWMSLSVKLPTSHQIAVTLPFAEPAGYGLAKSGWVTARFSEGDDIPLHTLMEWIDESYRAIAPKKLVATMDDPLDQEKVEAKPRKSRGSNVPSARNRKRLG